MLTDRTVRLEMPERQVWDLLLGHEVGITVSEPWDFEYPAGARMLAGHITDAGADSEEQRPSGSRSHSKPRSTPTSRR